MPDFAECCKNVVALPFLRHISPVTLPAFLSFSVCISIAVRVHLHLVDVIKFIAISFCFVESCFFLCVFFILVWLCRSSHLKLIRTTMFPLCSQEITTHKIPEVHSLSPLHSSIYSLFLKSSYRKILNSISLLQ